MWPSSTFSSAPVTFPRSKDTVPNFDRGIPWKHNDETPLTQLTTWLVLCVTLTLRLASPSFADSEADSKDGAQLDVVTFTLNQAVALALAVNPEVLAVREKTEEFGQAVREARAEALPQVDAMLTWRKTRDPGAAEQ